VDVVSLGILVADVIVKSVSTLPEKGKLTTVDSIDLSLGGCAANTAVGLSRLGYETMVIGAVGDYGLGDFIINMLMDEKIDTTGIIHLENAATSVTTVLVSPDGDRSFLHFKGANAAFTADDLDLQPLELARHLHVAGTFLMDAFDGHGAASVLKKAKEIGLTTSVDTAWDPSGRWWEIAAPMFDYIDIFLPSAEEARMMSGEDNVREMARFFLSKGVNIVGIKQGADGGYFRSGDNEIMLPALKVKVVDTTGCGDAFCAGFLAGYLDGMPLRECGRMAVTLGSLCATGIGATCTLPTREQLENTLAGLSND